MRFFYGLGLSVMIATGVNASDDATFMSLQNDHPLPSILIILDNSANWSSSVKLDKENRTKFAFEKIALRDFFNDLVLDAGADPRVRVGLMMFSQTANWKVPSDCPINERKEKRDGGYVRYAVRVPII
jgi:hypothetical protein